MPMPYSDPNEGSSFKRGSRRRAYAGAAINLLKGFQEGKKETMTMGREMAKDRLLYGGVPVDYEGKKYQTVGQQFVQPTAAAGGQLVQTPQGPVNTGFGDPLAIRQARMYTEGSMSRAKLGAQTQRAMMDARERMRGAGNPFAMQSILANVYNTAYRETASPDNILIYGEAEARRMAEESASAAISEFVPMAFGSGGGMPGMPQPGVPSPRPAMNPGPGQNPPPVPASPAPGAPFNPQVGQTKQYASEAEALAAEQRGLLHKGERVIIGGQSGTWQ